MGERKFIAPKPEVLHLTTLFRRIDSGEIRVPRFQRPFVWAEKNVIDLLESVYRGYPVGSLLFWRPDSSTLLADVPSAFGRDIPPAPSMPTYILDGQQRLTTLYRCFFGSEDPMFDVSFGLNTESFVHRADYRGDLDETVPLSALFSTREFIQKQQTLLSKQNGDRLADSAIRLHSRFQEYMIPAVTIEGRDVSEVVEIFERVNRTGTTLSAVDFMRAVTWSADFDLQAEVESLARKCADLGFNISDETLVKLVAIAADREPTAEDMVRLREADLPVLRHAVQLAGESAEKAIIFFSRELAVRSYDFVPYEAQFLVVCRAFQTANPLRELAINALTRWFWLSSFNESLRGTPDHVVARLVRAAKMLPHDAQSLPIGPLTLTKEALKTRRFLQGRALSSAVAALFAEKQARSVVSGEVLSVDTYMQGFVSLHYRPLCDAARPARVLANIFLCSEEDWFRVQSSRGPINTLEKLRSQSTEKFLRTLESQLIPEAAYESLVRGDIDLFLEQRAEAILSAAIHVTTSRD